MVEDKKILKDLGDKFKKARHDARLKQSEVATAAGINANYYAQVERGEVNLSYEKLYNIAKALNIKNLELS